MAFECGLPQHSLVKNFFRVVFTEHGGAIIKTLFFETIRKDNKFMANFLGAVFVGRYSKKATSLNFAIIIFKHIGQ